MTMMISPTEPKMTRRLTSDAKGVAEAGHLLRQGGLVAFPTETVYGLGADATQGEAVAGIYAAKGRPSFNPLIIHVASLEAARALGVFDDNAIKLAQAFWPGPLTIVVPKQADCPISELALAGLDSIALRVPIGKEALALIRAADRPIAAPSANRSGRISPTEAHHVLEDLDGLIDAVVIGPAAKVGVESSIVSCISTEPRLLRPGGLPREVIERQLHRPLANPVLDPSNDSAPVAPGMLTSHYAPRATVRLNVEEIEHGEAALLFGSQSVRGAEHAIAQFQLSETGDLIEAAARLFGALRWLDQSGAKKIAVSTIPPHGLGEAINDRLRRAAARRG
jgi:L-threonylcarbamoyladenylate synthase